MVCLYDVPSDILECLSRSSLAAHGLGQEEAKFRSLPAIILRKEFGVPVTSKVALTLRANAIDRRRR